MLNAETGVRQPFAFSGRVNAAFVSVAICTGPLRHVEYQCVGNGAGILQRDELISQSVRAWLAQRYYWQQSSIELTSSLINA